VLTIVLREDLGAPPAGVLPKGGDTGTFPPPPAPLDNTSDHIPATGLGPVTTRGNPRPTPTDAAFSPGAGATRPVPPTIGSPPGDPPLPDGMLPPPGDLSVPPKTARPENVADGPRSPFTPPAVSIPGPPTPPPSFPRPAPGVAPDPKQSRGRSVGNFTLLDTHERDWDFAANKAGSVVLVEFITTSCVPCKRAIPVMADLQSRYAASGLQVIAVVCDDLPQKQRAAAAAKYARDNNLNYALYIEPGEAGSVRDRFNVEVYPTAVLLDASGTVLWQGHPADPRNPIDAAVKRALGR
jgi:thiol-disulfide isomerase/thioredoxin